MALRISRRRRRGIDHGLARIHRAAWTSRRRASPLVPARRRDRADIPWIRVDTAPADRELGDDARGSRLLGARAIDPNRTEATIEPHSILERRPIGVPGGRTQPTLTTSRAFSMAAAVDCRCQRPPMAEAGGMPIVLTLS